MPRDNNRRKNNDRYDDRRSSRSQRGGRDSRSLRKQVSSYHPILQIFAVDKGDRISLNIKPIQTEKSSIEDVMSLDEWLFFCEQVYLGTRGYSFAGSLWESSIPQADWTGNIRLSDEQLETLKEDFDNSQGKQKKTAKKSKPPAKPKYEVPEEDNEDEEDYEEADDSEETTEENYPPY